jgi:hypothetical protein
MKTTRLLGASGAAVLSSALLLALAPAARAAFNVPDNDFTVTLNVASLGLNPDAPFSLAFQLIPGSGNVSNTVKIYNFSFTGGSPVGAPDFTAGSESGSVGANQIATLTNSSAVNEIDEEFSAGTTSISFNVDETPNAEVVGSGTPIPDQFNISIYGQSGNNIATIDPSGANTLVESDLGPEYTLNAYNGSGNGVAVLVATPEPSATALSLVAAGGLLGLVLIRRRCVA